MKKTILRSVVVAGALVAATAWAGAPQRGVKLDAKQLDAIAAGKITPHKINNGGNEPKGNANGVPTVNLNPSGKAPPGHN